MNQTRTLVSQFEVTEEFERVPYRPQLCLLSYGRLSSDDKIKRDPKDENEKYEAADNDRDNVICPKGDLALRKRSW